jgi:hypothetical protein
MINKFDIQSQVLTLIVLLEVNGKQQKKNSLGFIKESRPSFGSNYDDNYDDAMDHAGLGASSSSFAQQSAAVTSNQQFAKGKSKYLKTVLFTKSSSSVDLTKGISNDLIYMINISSYLIS